MKKIMVIGCCGAGKSTMSRKIHSITGLPLIHLDQIFWSAGWVEPDRDEWIDNNKKIVQNNHWIIDGNYGSTMDIRIKEADTIVYIDRPTYICLFRVLKRMISNYKKSRMDMPDGCPERLDFEFLKYVAFFNKIKRPNILIKLNAVKKEKQVFVLKNQKENETFISNLNRFN